MRGVKNEALRLECIRLRVEERLSLPQIHTKTGVSKGSLSVWLRPFPLSPEERSLKSSKGWETRKKNAASILQPHLPKQEETIVGTTLSKGRKGAAAQHTILAKLMWAGVQVFSPLVEDSPIDILVLSTGGAALKCQCKYIYQSKDGLYRMPLTSSRGSRSNRCKRHRYTKNEVDFFIGYCSMNEKVYVIPYDAVQNMYELVLWVDRMPIGKCDSASFDHLKYENNFAPLL